METNLSTENLVVDVTDGLAWVTLNRPEALNALDGPLMDTLAIVLGQLAEDPQIRCVALRGAGRGFCAGGDLGLIRERRDEIAAAPAIGTALDRQQRALVRQSQATRLLREMPKPTLAAVHGAAVGGGLALALACDVRVVAADAKIRVGFSARSLSGDYGISYLLVHTVGSARARELLLLDPPMSGDEAHRLGLMSESCSSEDLPRRAEAVARRLTDGPTVALGRMKANITAAEISSLGQVLEVEALNQRIAGNTADAAEAGAAGAERRPARFRGH